jgi:hypothetical protein
LVVNHLVVSEAVVFQLVVLVVVRIFLVSNQKYIFIMAFRLR